MRFNRSLTAACLQLVEQISKLKLLLKAKEDQLSELMIEQQALEAQHSNCEQEIEAMITPSSDNTEESETDTFKSLLRHSWQLKQAIDKCHTSALRLRQQITRLEKRIEAALILKANALKALKLKGGDPRLQNGLDVMLAKNQLLLGQYD
ncbi:hypothetical protein BIZ37_27385 [Photobacterium sp. BZF1]|uniref:hypothetical protein n=1 Tax=Photobacterium sp. BZF1 TaxID=1904457 RepID=UPI001653D6B5|nr:hypothetical protein [Photobacterium sp. BZF1]MBC7006286.1 hypothetical protein [Photobacterium sp. BZF1]